jgi:hypothetical protein
MPKCRLLSLIELTTLSLSKLPLLHRVASNDNDTRKMEEEAESSTAARKRFRHTDDDGGDGDSSDFPEEEPPQEEPTEEETEVEEEEEEETEEEVSSEVSSMNQLDTSEEKLYARHAHGYLFDDGDTPSMSPDTPPTPGSHRRSNDEGSDDDDFWM